MAQEQEMMTSAQPTDQMLPYTPPQLMACAAARILEDGQSVFVGTGLPIVAATLAMRTHAPDLVIVFEAGGVAPQIPVLPMSVGDSRTYYRAIAASSMRDVMGACQAGYVDFGFLGAAMIDEYGNINTTVIGEWDQPRVRLPGSGGANDVGSLCRRTIVVMRQDKRRFVRRLDFLTTPGYLSGPGSREAAGLPSGTGPYRVVTQYAVYGFEELTKRLEVISLHPGITVQDLKLNCSFDLLVPTSIPTTDVPSAEDLKVLRDIDPLGISV
jgi:glutaconate CoA-transferase subunit B